MKAGELFENAINHWRDAKGIGTALIPSPLNDKIMVLGILQRIYARSPTIKTTIIVQHFHQRNELIEFITTRENEEENNEEFKQLLNNGNIKIYTFDFVDRLDVHVYPTLCVLYNIDNVNEQIENYLGYSKFKLVVLNNLLSNNKVMAKLYQFAPLLPDFKQNELEELRLSTPVEELRIGVNISEDDENKKLLDYYTEYISTSINIFGSFEIMQQAHQGNLKLNISANQICNQLAIENGWNDRLDMSVEINREIDRLYNPMNLKERATQTYEIIRNRNQLLSDYNGKLEEIFKIVNNNPDKKILIINKRADFATLVTAYINDNSEKNICMNYHDKVDNIPAVNAKGNPVYYKTGMKKGQRKFMGAKAQKSYAILKFNDDVIRVLSTNNVPDKDLTIDVDIIIITSPQCEDINAYMYRLSNVNFRNNLIELYSIYCKGTSEQKALERKSLAKCHNVKNAFEDENFSDFSIAD